MLEYLRAKVPNLLVVDTDAAIRELGNPKVVNVVLLGAAVRSGALGLTAPDLQEVIRERLPEKLHEINFRALSGQFGS